MLDQQENDKLASFLSPLRQENYTNAQHRTKLANRLEEIALTGETGRGRPSFTVVLLLSIACASIGSVATRIADQWHVNYVDDDTETEFILTPIGSIPDGVPEGILQAKDGRRYVIKMIDNKLQMWPIEDDPALLDRK